MSHQLISLEQQFSSTSIKSPWSIHHPPGSRNPIYTHLQDTITPDLLADLSKKDLKSKVVIALQIFMHCALHPYNETYKFSTTEAPRQLRKMLRRGVGHAWEYSAEKGRIALKAKCFDQVPVPARNHAEYLLQGITLENMMAISSSPNQHLLFKTLFSLLLEVVQKGIGDDGLHITVPQPTPSLVLWSIHTFFTKYWKASISNKPDGFTLFLEKKKEYAAKATILPGSKGERKHSKKTTPLDERVLDYAL